MNPNTTRINDAIHLGEEARFVIDTMVQPPFRSLPAEDIQELNTKLKATLEQWLTSYVNLHANIPKPTKSLENERLPY